MKKTKKYIQDFNNTFWGQHSESTVFAFLERLKQAQKSAYPSDRYKQSLAWELQEKYTSARQESLAPKLSIFQFFWAFASIACISLVLSWIYIFQKDTSYTVPMKEDMIAEFSGEQQETEIQKNPESLQVFPAEVSHFLAEEFLPEMMWESSEDTRESGNMHMMQAEDSQSIYELQMQEFYNICYENGGKLLDDAYTCEFENGEVCFVDNISPESLQPCEYLYSREKEE